MRREICCQLWLEFMEEEPFISDTRQPLEGVVWASPSRLHFTPSWMFTCTWNTVAFYNFILLTVDNPQQRKHGGSLRLTRLQGDITRRSISPKQMAHVSPRGLLRSETSVSRGVDRTLAPGLCQQSGSGMGWYHRNTALYIPAGCKNHQSCLTHTHMGFMTNVLT